jgi:hypothetical protein
MFGQCGRPPPPPLLDALAPDPADALEAELADELREAELLPGFELPRELPLLLALDPLNTRSVVTERGTLGGGIAALGGATLRALGTLPLGTSRPAARSEVGATWRGTLPERCCSADSRAPWSPEFTKRCSIRSKIIAEL